MNHYIRVLQRNPQYFRLWVAQAVSLLGDWFSTIALSTLVVRYSNGSGLAVSGLLLARFVPPMIVGPLAGVVIDRMNRKYLLIFSDTLRTVIVLMFLLASSPDRLWLIYALTVFQFSLSALFEPCRSALLPALVEDRDLVLANTLGSTTWSAMLAVGAVIGGTVAALFGTPIALCIDASSFLLSALLIASIKGYSPNTANSSASAIVETGTRGSFMAGLRYIRSQPATAAVLLVKLGGNVGSIDLIMVIYATQLFVVGQNGTGSLGILYGTFGIGAILGAIVISTLKDESVQRMRRLIVVGYLCISIGWFLVGASPTLLIAALVIIIKAVGSSLYWTYSSVILQKTVPDQFRGRLFALDLAGFQFAVVISSLLTGMLLDHAAALSGLSLATALSAITGHAVFLASETAIRTIVYGTAAASLVPLVLWSVALPWIERARQPVLEGPVTTPG